MPRESFQPSPELSEAETERVIDHAGHFSEEITKIKQGCDLRQPAGRTRYRQQLMDLLRASGSRCQSDMEQGCLDAVCLTELINLNTQKREGVADYREGHKNFAASDVAYRQKLARLILENENNPEVIDAFWNTARKLSSDREQADRFQRGLISEVAAWRLFKEAGINLVLPEATPSDIQADAEYRIDFWTPDHKTLVQVKTASPTHFARRQLQGPVAQGKLLKRFSVDDSVPTNPDEAAFLSGCQKFARDKGVFDPDCYLVHIPHSHVQTSTSKYGESTRTEKPLVDSAGIVSPVLQKAFEQDLAEAKAEAVTAPA